MMLFTGCVGANIITTVDRDGSVTTHVLGGMYLDEDSEPPMAQMEINGKHYSIDIDQTRNFATPEAFELSFEQYTDDGTMMSAISVAGVSMAKTDDGFVLRLDLSECAEDEMFAQVFGKTEYTEDEQAVIDTMETMLYFTMPAYSEIEQTSGPDTGVTIVSNSLTLDLMEIMTTLKEPCLYEFAVHVPEIDEFRFTDVNESHWFFPAVDKAARAGVVQGYPDHTFRPGGEITYAEFAQMVARQQSWEVGEKNGKWFGLAVESCLAHGVIEEQQNYNTAITREEAIYGLALLKTWSTDPVRNITIEDIPDGAGINPKYADKIVEMYNFGGCNGNDEKLTFRPFDSLTRAEVAQLFLNLDYLG
jgi:hypothetical protein